MSGWRRSLNAHFDAPVCNLADGVPATESFLAFHVWNALLAEVALVDTALIKFGHNSPQRPELAPREAAAWPAGLTDETHVRRPRAEPIAAFAGRFLRAIYQLDSDGPARGSELVH